MVYWDFMEGPMCHQIKEFCSLILKISHRALYSGSSKSEVNVCTFKIVILFKWNEEINRWLCSYMLWMLFNGGWV